MKKILRIRHFGGLYLIEIRIVELKSPKYPQDGPNPDPAVVRLLIPGYVIP